ncbi:ATP-binding protein [Bradyrhizobium hipponense]|uniref:ATP-binding protein n=1 Tax=Bradyrhizobium hipponense TaxID=2605638 RepID=UPI003D310E68
MSCSATALLDRLLHHAVFIQIEGSSYRLREHADLVPEPPQDAGNRKTHSADLKRRGRPPRKRRCRSRRRLIAIPPSWGILRRHF